MINKIVLAMASLRLMSGGIEMLAALVMLRLNQVDKALVVNSSLALVGPLVLLTTTAVGLAGLADRLSPSKLAWIAAGVTCLLIGILKK
jgi:putative exporter of polyketide antibiotics